MEGEIRDWWRAKAASEGGEREDKRNGGGIRAEKWTGFSQTTRGARVHAEPGRRVWVSTGEGGGWACACACVCVCSFVHREWREEGG